MTKSIRAIPFRKKGRKAKKKQERNQLEIIENQGAKNRQKIYNLTEEELSSLQVQATQNAMTVFNELLKQFEIRIPKMSDETLVAATINIWAKINGEKK